MINFSNKQDCCGCHACMQKCPKHSITMKMDEEGFLYPNVDKTTCVDCGLCEKVCPVLIKWKVSLPLQVFAAKNNDDSICKNSSSGGVFFLLAEKTIMDGGVVFGARFDRLWDVEHAYTENIEGITQFMGSKYVQSRIGNTYQKAEEFLKAGRQVLFTGTPCQIAGLKHYLRREYDNLLCVDVICHGSPSPGVWRDYLRSIISPVGRKNTVSSSNYSPLSERYALQIKGISFRDKRLGWKKFSFVLHTSQGGSRSEGNSVSPSIKTFSEPVYKSLWMRSMLHNFMLRPSCYNCPARKGSSGSDILLGDFWGINRCYPEFYSEKGVSLVLAYTEKGKAIIQSFGLILHNATYADALDCNANIEQSEKMPDFRNTFFESCNKIGSVNSMIKTCKEIEPHPVTILLKKVIRKIQIILSKK